MAVYNWPNSDFIYSYTFSTTGWLGPQKEDDMTTGVVELAAGYVGTVFASVDGSKVAVADTRPYKRYESAERAAKRLALDIVKNGYSG